MASSGGNSSGSTQKLPNSGSEGDLMDQRKRKRMQSNRESARRSRQRKQNHIDELMAQAAQLRKENNQIITTTNLTNQQFAKVEAENSVLKAQMDELTQRLQSLNEILDYINNTTAAAAIATAAAATTTTACTDIDGVFEMDNLFGLDDHQTSYMNNSNNNNNSWNMMYPNQPIMADMFMY
ncbi:bZIP transcription factor 44-like [Apium graveolens]|uniref:bZIP transcription factor 44-like n=1 Tax=Apium graveolens TaxID=4045 RepID=UPI003D7B18C0